MDAGAPTRQFAVVSLLIIGLITGALSAVIGYLVRQDLLDREWRVTADYIQTEALQGLTAADFTEPWRPASQARFEAFYRQTVTMPEIVRVNIYDARMTIVWSDEPRLLGQQFPENPHLRGATAGRTMVSIESGDGKPEHRHEGPDLPELVEVYVPLMFEGVPGVVGVVETYKQPVQVFANIRRGQVTVLATALAGGILLHVSLFWIVRRAARRIEAQHAALEQRSRELAAANDELQAVQAQLVEAERMAAIGEVVTAVAHNIRNPLANIRASAQVASLAPAPSSNGAIAPRHLADIIGEVDRLEARLRALLQFVRPARRQLAPVDLNAILRETVHATRQQVPSRGIRVEAALEPVPAILGDAMLLEQVFLSLLSNAIEAVPEAGMVWLISGTTRDDAGRAQVFVEIRDTGIGIGEETMARLFEPFYTTKAQGSGLGLATARKFVWAHGGSIAAQSHAGGGSTFRVTLPVPAEA